jgi:hypothetical protein
MVHRLRILSLVPSSSPLLFGYTNTTGSCRVCLDRPSSSISVYASNRVVPDSQVYLALDARLTGNRRGHAAPANLQQGWTQSLAHTRTSIEGVQTVCPRRFELPSYWGGQEQPETPEKRGSVTRCHVARWFYYLRTRCSRIGTLCLTLDRFDGRSSKLICWPVALH